MRAQITGNKAAAIAAKLCRPQIISAYPITPQTTIIEYLSQMVANGEINAEYIKVESEHSAMAACIGAAAAGCRVFTATSSQGLLLMHEMLFQASGLRLPIVMVNVNRAVGAPWTIYTDQTDSMAQRDTGWIQFYCENVQEVLDMIIQSYRIAEKISLPIMVISEGFVLSHTTEPTEIPEQDKVDEFLPPYQPKWKLDADNPMAFGGHVSSIQYAELRRSIQKAMEEAGGVQLETADEFRRFFGRKYLPVEFEGRPDPEVLLVTSGTISGTAREVLKSYPDVSLMKIRMFRPFPYDLVRKLSWRSGKIVVLDRNISFGSRGIFAESVRSSLYDSVHRPSIFEFIAGIGGTDVTPKIISDILDYVLSHNFPASRPIWQSELACLAADRRG